ncbi:MAG: Gfo/Idh/MocA family oxidoreductase [Bacteroidales bacterium]|nr:Gfo/Idh/MocA family oxidoreductase [Bacteroidales bacterium]
MNKSRILLFVALLLLATVRLPASEPFRIAVAGVTHDHLNGVVSQLRRGDIQVVGVWEADPRYIHDNSLSRVLPENIFFSDLGKMLDATKPEAVVAYGSIKEHLAVVEACAPRGIHVMVEKPLATTLKDARKMADLARKHGILLLTNYETTWYASNHYVKAQVDAGKIGDIFRIEVYDGHQGPVEIGCSKKFLDWLTDPVLNGGGAVMDFGCYGANLATWLLGGKKPVSVYAVLQTNKPSVYTKVDDDATIVVEYPGATVEINASWCWPYNRKDMFVYGHEGLLYQANPTRVEGIKKGEWTDAPALASPYDNPFHLLEAAVRGEITISPGDLSSLENNLVVVEILSAAVKSARTGRPVRIK